MGNAKVKYESVKISVETIEILRQHKEKSGVPISVFIERLVKKALSKK